MHTIPFKFWSSFILLIWACQIKHADNMEEQELIEQPGDKD